MSINKEIIDRLVCAKYMFQRGNELLERGGPFSDGLTILLFQDSVEMCLRAIAEHHHCNLKDNVAFNQIIDEIDKIGIGGLTHRTALNQLNKARSNFKHFGLQTKHADVVKFRNDLDAFFPLILNTFLNINYDSVSLIDLINHCRVRNHLHKAEKFIELEEYSESIISSAVAFVLYRSYSSIFRERTYQKSIHSGVHRELSNFLDGIYKSINQQQDQISLIMDGINLRDYRRFIREIPTVNLSAAKTFEIVWFADMHPDRFSEDRATLCLRFATDSILLMQQNKLPTSFNNILPERNFKVLHDCDIIVWPSENPEVIRLAKAGEVLQGYQKNYDKSDYIAILQDDESAYVKREALEAV